MHRVGEGADGQGQGGGAPIQGAGNKPLVIERLGDHHRVADFKCRAKAKTDRVERFLTNQQRQYEGSRFARFFVASQVTDPGKVLGYYTLSAAAVRCQDATAKISGSERRRVPGNIDFPVAKLGYMGKSDDCPGDIEMGDFLLLDAVDRLTRLEVLGVWGMVLDAELGDPNKEGFAPDHANDKLVGWYRDRGFVELDDQPIAHLHTMFAKLSWIADALKA